jgi:hypothetical protein
MDVLDTLQGTGVLHFGDNAATVTYVLTITRTRGGIVSGHGTITGRPAIIVRAAEFGRGTLARLNGDKVNVDFIRKTDGTAFVKTTGTIPGY